jgi:hypothetical protein
MCHKWPRICSTCRKHFPVVSSFMTYHMVCNYINTTGATSGEGTTHPSGAPEFTPVFRGVCVTRSLVLCVCFVDRCLSFCTFSFGHCVVCSSSIHGFWLPLWYLQTLLNLFMCWVAWNVSHWMLCDKQSNKIYLFTRITYPSKWWVQDWL